MFDMTDQVENQRTIETNGAKIFINRKDPFGLWYIAFERGELPEWLKGAYTSVERATADINVYIEKHAKREKKVA